MLPRSDAIPFHAEHLTGRELDYVGEVLRSRRLAGGGPFTVRCERWLESHLGGGRVLLTGNGEAALDLAARLCGFAPGDEVILPSFAFFPTASAFLREGARLVFADVCEDTLTLDPARVEAAVTARTRAVVAVHYAGLAADLPALADLARRHGLLLIEDCGQGFGASLAGRPLGAWGDLACLCFHATRPVSCGEGGALVVRGGGRAARAEVLRERGSTRAAFLRGEAARYAWVEAASASLPAEVAAAVLLAQLEGSAETWAKRRALWQAYRQDLAPLAAAGLLRLPAVPAGATVNGYAFPFLARDAGERSRILAHVAAAGIGATSHFEPLHEEPVARRLGWSQGDLPVTEDVSRRLVRLPCHPELSEEQRMRVVRCLERLYE